MGIVDLAVLPPPNPGKNGGRGSYSEGGGVLGGGAWEGGFLRFR